MPRTYDPEFRPRVVDLVRAGKPVAVVAADLGLAEATVYRWKGCVRTAATHAWRGRAPAPRRGSPRRRPRGRRRRGNASPSGSGISRLAEPLPAARGTPARPPRCGPARGAGGRPRAGETSPPRKAGKAPPPASSPDPRRRRAGRRPASNAHRSGGKGGPPAAAGPAPTPGRAPSGCTSWRPILDRGEDGFVHRLVHAQVIAIKNQHPLMDFEAAAHSTNRTTRTTG